MSQYDSLIQKRKGQLAGRVFPASFDVQTGVQDSETCSLVASRLTDGFSSSGIVADSCLYPVRFTIEEGQFTTCPVGQGNRSAGSTLPPVASMTPGTELGAGGKKARIYRSS